MGETVYSTTVRAFLRGRWWPVVGGSVDRETPHAIIPGGSDMVAATGELLIAKPSTVGLSDQGWSAWVDDPPQPGEPVLVEASTDGGLSWSRRFTGEVDDLAGDVYDRVLRISLVDRIAALSGELTMGALSHRHPPRATGTPYLDWGLNSLYFVDLIARRSGFYATPPNPAGTVVSVPGQGSVRAEVGDTTTAAVMAADAATDGLPSNYPSFRRVSWGLAVMNIDTSIVPDARSANVTWADGSLFVRGMVPSVESANTDPTRPSSRPRVTVTFPGGSRCVVRTSTEGLTVDLFVDQTGDVPNSYDRHVWPLTDDQRARGFEWRIFLTRTGVLSVWIDGVAGTHARPMLIPAGMTSAGIESVRIQSAGPGAAIGGVQVGYTVLQSALDWTPTAVLEGEPVGTLSASPSLVRRDTLELLKEQSAALFCATWLDEDGVLRHVPRNLLQGRRPVGTLDASHYASLPWTVDREALVRSCEVRWEQPNHQRALDHRVTLWQPSSGYTLTDMERVDEVIHPPSGEDWVYVSPIRELASGRITPYNRGVWSWFGAVIHRPDMEEPDRWRESLESWQEVYLNSVDPRTWVLTIIPVTVLSEDRQMVTVAPGWPSLRVDLAGVPTPIIRGRMKITWSEGTATSTLSGHPAGRHHVHEMGWWGQRVYTTPIFPLRTADEVVRQGASIFARLDRMVLAAPVPEVRQNDSWRIVGGGFDGRCLVVGVHDDYSEGRWSMSVDLYQQEAPTAPVNPFLGERTDAPPADLPVTTPSE